MDGQPSIFLVEDDPEIRALVTDYLSANACQVTAFPDAAAMDAALAERAFPDLIVLDLMLPGEDGLSVCRRLRARSEVPIVMLTARSEDVDRIVGLEVGADDYLGKPFNPRELLARIRAVLRRQGNGEATAASHGNRRRFDIGPVVVDLDARVVRDRDGHKIEVTSAEFELLACFIERPGRVLSRDQLMDWTRGREAAPFDRTIDVQMSRLRKKIAFGDEALITTVRGKGYMLTAQVRQL